jgi:hypothetical protein
MKSRFHFLDLRHQVIVEEFGDYSCLSQGSLSSTTYSAVRIKHANHDARDFPFG